MLTPEQKRKMEKILNEMDDTRDYGKNQFAQGSSEDEEYDEESTRAPHYNNIHKNACRNCCWFFGSESCAKENCKKR